MEKDKNSRWDGKTEKNTEDKRITYATFSQNSRAIYEPATNQPAHPTAGKTAEMAVVRSPRHDISCGVLDQPPPPPQPLLLQSLLRVVMSSCLKKEKA